MQFSQVNKKIKKLAFISIKETRYRLAKKIRKLYEQRCFEREALEVGSDRFVFFDDNKKNFSELYLKGRTEALLDDPHFMRKCSEPLDSKKRQTFLDNYHDEVVSCFSRADCFLRNEFAVLGREFTLPNPIPWQSDPLSLCEFERSFYELIDVYRNDTVGDVKHVWEINRLQFVIEIAKAHFLSGEERYYRKINEVVRDWYVKNPYKIGIAWASALEVGVRAIALIWILNFYRNGNRVDGKTVQILLKLIYLHGRYLEHNLSFFSSPYNHLIGEATALFMVGYLFPGFKSSESWESKGWRILLDEVEKQFHCDGMSVEQASFYHHFTLGFFLQAVALRRLNQDKVPGYMMQRLEKALEFPMYMTKPDGTMPYIGDIDDGRSIYFSDPTNWNFRMFQSIGASWFKRGDMKFMAKKYHEEAFWLLSTKDAETFTELPMREPEHTCRSLEASGYYVFRSGYEADSHYSYIDCGPIAHGVWRGDIPSAAHGHADLLSIEIAPHGESFLIDPGFTNYRGDFDWHRYFRSTAAHNTIEVDGQSQAKHGNIMEWSCAPPFKVLQTFQSETVQGICAEHYGYRRLPGKPIHRRYFLFVDKLLWITFDQIWGKKNRFRKHNLDYHLHLNDRIKAVVDDNTKVVNCRGRESELSIKFVPQNNGELKLYSVQGGVEPHQGWISPTYLAKTPAPVLVASSRTYLPFQIFTIFLSNRIGDNNKLILREDDSKLIVYNDNYEYHIFVNDEPFESIDPTSNGILGKVVVHKVQPEESLLVLDPHSTTRKDRSIGKNSQFIELIKGN